ncbi:MAG: DUF2791 family P-loop domain-containing protein [Chloroflexota bacterium]|nr:DUF2791 family P-loop domain-containing protein [Chloroflexota bacterium]
MKAFSKLEVTRSQARLFLKALLDGVPPHSLLTSWLTVGQEQLMTTFDDDLKSVADGGFRSLFLLGNPGSGKSQLLITLEHLAMQQGFVSAYFSQDVPGRLAFNRPDQIYRRIMETMRLPGNPKGNVDVLQDVLDEWTNRSLPRLRHTNRSMAIMYQLSEAGLLPGSVEQIHRRTSLALVGYIVATERQDEDARMQFLSALKGPGLTNSRLIEIAKDIELRIPRYVGYTPSQYDADYYFSQLRTLIFIFKSLGYKGMAVLFDEVTAIIDLGSRSREKAYKVLDSLLVDSYRFRGLYTVFAYMPPFMTQLRADRGIMGHEHLERWRHLVDDRMIELSPLSRADQEELLRRLSYLHGVAYDWPATEVVGPRAGSLARAYQESGLPTREFVRMAIDSLDLLYETHR